MKAQLILGMLYCRMHTAPVGIAYLFNAATYHGESADKLLSAATNCYYSLDARRVRYVYPSSALHVNVNRSLLVRPTHLRCRQSRYTTRRSLVRVTIHRPRSAIGGWWRERAISHQRSQTDQRRKSVDAVHWYVNNSI